MLVTNPILYGFIHCQYKAYLINKQQLGCTSEYQKIYTKLKQQQIENYEKKVSAVVKEFANNISFDNLSNEEGIAINVKFSNENIDILLDGIEFFKEQIPLPIFITPFEKVSRLEKLFLALQTNYIQANFNFKAEHCKIIYGQDLKETKFKISTFSKIIKKICSDLTKLYTNSNPPLFYKNQHCQICEFQNLCLEKLMEKDDLSLLTSLKPKEILQKNNRGIFSVTQLSYLFRPKKNPYRKRKFLPELKALAIREGKTFIQEMPNLKEVETEVFIDFEGILDRNSNYLIGVIIRTGETQKGYSFWANNKEEENAIFIQLIELIKPLKNFIIYHYGFYEIQVLKSVSKKMTVEYQDFLKVLIENSCNILNIFTLNIYPPTYSNSLKEIARFIKFEWSDKDASGLQSVVWRYEWELAHDEYLKNKLITYNIEDCKALIRVKDWVGHIEKEDNDKQFVGNYKNETIFKWGVTNYITNDFKEVNDKAYFNYQKEHIFFRVEKKKYKRLTDNDNIKSVYNKSNKIVKINSDECPYCKSKELAVKRVSKKTTLDLVFLKTGIKKQATEYIGGTMRCKKCKKGFSIGNRDIRKVPMYGHNLLIWSVNQKIQYLQSSENIIGMLKDLFKIEVSLPQMVKFKETISKKYLSTYKEIINNITQSELIHIDETSAKIKGIDGYVWVFVNHSNVYYIFRETRETDFLTDLIKYFTGVLVSDFYTGYDSLQCKQQKCIIHLIRDLNEDFLKYQLDYEFKKIIVEFGFLLKKIITTIDKYGLKNRHLNKHKNDVESFYSKIILSKFESENAIAYQKRFVKYKEKLFCFLEHDNIPWNNNNAEHAIKPFAVWRQGKFMKSLTKDNIENHLILLSILQTCKYRGLNFFEFLKSGETNLEQFSTKQGRRGKSIKN